MLSTNRERGFSRERQETGETRRGRFSIVPRGAEVEGDRTPKGAQRFPRNRPYFLRGGHTIRETRPLFLCRQVPTLSTVRPLGALGTSLSLTVGPCG